MVAIQSARHEVRARDGSRRRAVLTIGILHFHLSRREVMKLMRDASHYLNRTQKVRHT